MFEAAAATGTALEINGSPHRLDLSAERARRAVGRGCLLSIDSDAHRTEEELEYVRWGVDQARRGWGWSRAMSSTRAARDGVLTSVAGKPFAGLRAIGSAGDGKAPRRVADPGAMARYGRLQLVKSPVHGLTLVSLDRAVLEEVLRNKKIAPMLGARLDDDTVVVHTSERGRVKQMLLKIGWPAEDLAGYVDGESAPDQPRSGRLAAARLPGDGRRLVLGGRLGCGGTAVRCGQDPGRRCGDGQGGCDDADPGHQHRRGQAVEARADHPHVADRGRDRRILRREEGDPSGHHRHVPGDHPAHQGRVPAPRAVRQPRLGADHLRRGAPAARAGVPDDGRSAVPAAARPDGHPDPRGRPRGRRVQSDRSEALRRAVEGHRGPGLDRTGRVHRGAGDDDRQRADALRGRRARGTLQAVLDGAYQDRGGEVDPASAIPASRRW